MYFDRKCKITYIAHGATIYSDENRFSDVENYPPLSEEGIEEVNKLCDFLRIRRIKNDKIISSSATRTLQTAKIIAKMYKQEFEVVNTLSTRKCGSYNGLTFEQVEEKYPEALYKLINDTKVPTPDDAEAVSDFVKRISKSINTLVNTNIGSRIIVVTHPDVIKAAVCKALKMPHSSLQHIYIKTGSATQISYFEKWESLVYCDHTPAV
ncbi:MAG: phosphoglycerate mutase family protein [Clostridiaceae bacterium]|jgi:ribonuclease H / adenosylcobalamin/alpha-ribazole phosphatase|nr:phosphoglycerate mutase family protein [Clostridiaceae bacterium]